MSRTLWPGRREGYVGLEGRVAALVLDHDCRRPTPWRGGSPRRTAGRSRWPAQPRGTKTGRWYQTSPTWSCRPGSTSTSLKLLGTGIVGLGQGRATTLRRGPRRPTSAAKLQMPSSLLVSRVSLSCGRSIVLPFVGEMSTSPSSPVGGQATAVPRWISQPISPTSNGITARPGKPGGPGCRRGPRRSGPRPLSPCGARPRDRPGSRRSRVGPRRGGRECSAGIERRR